MNIKNIIREEIQKMLLEDVTNFNNILNSKNRMLNESNINRMLHWLKGCDCAFITAFRKEFKDIRDKDATYFGPNGDWEEGKKFSHEENRQKNKLMVAELLQLGYGVTKVQGVYPETPKTNDAPITDNEDIEESYLVVNRHNDENFLKNLQRIAEFYNQDSIYYKEAGQKKDILLALTDVAGLNTMRRVVAANYILTLGLIICLDLEIKPFHLSVRTQKKPRTEMIPWNVLKKHLVLMMNIGNDIGKTMKALITKKEKNYVEKNWLRL